MLGFGSEWKVEKLEFNELTNEVDIYLDFNLKSYKENHKNTYENLYDYREMRRWRHLNIMQYKTFICARIPRIKSQSGKITSVKVPWAGEGERHSFLFEKQVVDVLLATKNQTKTASLMDCGFNIINRILHLSAKRGLERRDENVRYKRLSIDEKSFQKGHKYATVLSNPDDGSIIDLVESRTKCACKELLNSSLSAEQQSHIECVSMDMWKPFLSAVEEVLPKSKKVHDRFHLIKYLNDAVDKVRRRELASEPTLINSKYSMLKNVENLTKKQYLKFEDVLRINTKVSKAWRLKECFKDLFGCVSYKEAENRFSDWRSFCKWENIPEIMKVVNMFSSHFKGVCNALSNNLSNGMAERLNGKIQEIKTIGKGYRKFENFRSAILFFNGNLKLYPLG